MPVTSDPVRPQAETAAETAEGQIARIKSEIAQVLQPLREAASAGDFAAVKKLYRNLIRTYHEDKFQDATVKAAVSKLNKSINRIDAALKTDVPEAQRQASVEAALAEIEGLSRTDAAGEALAEVTEADIESETATISHELEALGRECRAAWDGLQAAGRKIWELQQLQAALGGLSAEFRAAHQTEITKITESTAELQARLTELNSRFIEAQQQLSFFRHYAQERASLADAPRQMRELADQFEATKAAAVQAAEEFERENKVAETLSRQMEKHQAHYLELQSERMRIAQWQIHLDQQLFQFPPFSQAFNTNRQQRQELGAQDMQVFTRMQELAATMQNLNQQQMSNAERRRLLWQRKLALEAQGNQIYAAQAAGYENVARRQAVQTETRKAVEQAVRTRKRRRAAPDAQAET